MCKTQGCDGKATELVTRPADGGIKFVCGDCRDELIVVYGWSLAASGSEFERGSIDPSGLKTD